MSEEDLADVRIASTTTLLNTPTLALPIERVWAALTDPQQLRRWAPFLPDRDLGSVGSAQLTMLDGAELAREPTPGTVTTVEPPHLLAYSWGDDFLRWELTSIDGGTSLTLRHTLTNLGMRSAVCAGWHLCLEAANALLAGRNYGPVAGSAARDHGWDKLNLAYAQALGIEASKIPDEEVTRTQP